MRSLTPGSESSYTSNKFLLREGEPLPSRSIRHAIRAGFFGKFSRTASRYIKRARSSCASSHCCTGDAQASDCRCCRSHTIRSVCVLSFDRTYDLNAVKSRFDRRHYRLALAQHAGSPNTSAAPGFKRSLSGLVFCSGYGALYVACKRRRAGRTRNAQMARIRSYSRRVRYSILPRS